MTNYRSLVGGFFSSNPYDRKVPTSIRCNNPGAVNGASWEKKLPGYVTDYETTAGNSTTVFETPEHGVAVWYELLRRYRASGAKTIHDIIWKYGGGQANYTVYAKWVAAKTGLSETTEIKLNDDATLLKFGKAMFAYEAGKVIPWSDAQILYGLKLGRSYTSGPTPPLPAPKPAPKPVATVGIFATIAAAFAAAVNFLEITMEYVLLIVIAALVGYVVSIFTWPTVKAWIDSKKPPAPPVVTPAPPPPVVPPAGGTT